MQAIKTALDQITLGEPTTFRGLSVFPLLADLPAGKFYLTLDEAQAKQGLTITEVSEGGDVPELLLDNKLPLPVLLLDGEELVGAKQNRVLNLSVLAPAKSKIKIPVSCVERGRWSYDSDDFKAADRAQFAGGRANKMQSVNLFMSDSGIARSDQGEVWNHIAEKSARMSVQSNTDAMSDIFENHQHTVDDYVASFKAQPEQSGALFAVNGKVTGFDLFDNPQTLGELLPKLLRSYALDAIEQSASKNTFPEVLMAEGLIRAVCQAKAEVFKACGEGEDVRLNGASVIAGALVQDDRLIHLAAFYREQGHDSGRRSRSGRYVRASSRRRMRDD